MMIGPKTDAYAKRFNRVLDYIDHHLDEPISVDVLSSIASFSKFHFHRQFADYCGINVGRYVQLIKLRRASYRLVFNPDERIIDIAFAAGFENPESFSRAFKAAFDQTPRAFRKAPAWEPWSLRCQFHFPNRDRIAAMDVTIITVEPQLVAALEHKGPPTLLNGSIQQFITWRKTTGLSPIASNQSYGIGYHDPDLTPGDDFRFDICATVSAAVPDNPQGVITKTIPGGRCAVVRYIGSRARIGEGVYYLYRTWLPTSGEELRDFPVYFQYFKLDHDLPEHEHLTDIYLPLAEVVA